MSGAEKAVRLSSEDAVKLQQRMAKQVISRDVLDLKKKIRHVCGVDVSYKVDKAFACAVVLERESLSVVDRVCIQTRTKHPYIPGLLFLRESEPILRALEALKHASGDDDGDDDYQVLMVDAHGLLHPRRFGLACYIGLKVDKPTIGVGKSLLCGRVVKKGRSAGAVMLDGEELGAVLGGNGKKPVYVSVGHKIGLRTAVKLVKEVSRYRLPEPLRLAHIGSRAMMMTAATKNTRTRKRKKKVTA